MNYLTSVLLRLWLVSCGRHTTPIPPEPAAAGGPDVSVIQVSFVMDEFTLGQSRLPILLYRGTPTFFIKGHPVIGAQLSSAFQQVIVGLLGQ